MYLPRDAITLRPDGPSCVVVVSDTHSRLHPGALAQMAARSPLAILHAGDVGDASVLDALSEVAPVFAVRGNIDRRGLPDARLVAIGGLQVLLLHIGVYGPRLRANVRRQASKLEAGLVICGHSHVPLIAQEGGLTVFNPGSVGPQRYQLPIVFGTLELREDGAHLAHVDATTGEIWQPGPGR